MTAPALGTRPPWATIAALTMLGVVAAFLGTSRYGAVVTTDSVSYLSAARSFASDRVLVGHDGSPFVLWPPLVPVLLSVRAPSLAAAADTARFLNLLCFGATIALSGAWLHRQLTRRWLAGVGTALVALALPLLRVSGAAWSEPVFILLCLLALRFVDRARAPEVGLRDAVIAGAFAGLAMLARYAGCLLVLSCAIALLWPSPTALRRRLTGAVAFIVVAVGPTAGWLVYRWTALRGPSGYRKSPRTSVGNLFATAVDTVTRWFVPPPVPVALRALAVAAVLTAVGVAAGRARAAGAGWERRAAAALPYALLIPIYGAGVMISATLTRLDPPGYRILSPIFVPGLFVAMVVLDTALDGTGRAGSQAIAAGLAGLVAYELALAVFVSLPGEQRHLAGFEGPRWSQSALLARLDEVPGGTDVRTNRSTAVYFRTGRVIESFPYQALEGDARGLDRVGGSATLVWFDEPSGDQLGPLERAFVVEPILVVADGGVYRVSARPSA